MPANVDPQTTIYETTIEDADLEAMLERRETARKLKSDAIRAYNEAHELVKTRTVELDLADGPVRVGRFVVARHELPGGTVSFEKSASSRLQISLIPDA
jgi:hypothetical protein